MFYLSLSPLHALAVVATFFHFAVLLLGFISVGKVFGKSFRIVGLMRENGSSSSVFD